MRSQLGNLPLLNSTQNPLVPAIDVNKCYCFPSPLIRLRSWAHQSACPFLLHSLAAKVPWFSLKYQLRLYCTSSSHFALGAAGLRFGGTPCPIEFPPTCEIRVNQVQITASTKGMKKKPGTAPPAHLGNSVRVSIGHQNRVEMVYVNSQTNGNQPPPSPKVRGSICLYRPLTSCFNRSTI